MSGQIPKDLDIQARPLGHLSLVVSLIDDLGITDVLRDMLPKDPRSNVCDADCVAAMVMNVLGCLVPRIWPGEIPGNFTGGEARSASRACPTQHAWDTGVVGVPERPRRAHRAWDTVMDRVPGTAYAVRGLA